MAYSTNTYVADGTTNTFPLAFTLGILSRSHVTCRVNDEVDGLGAPLYRSLSWLSDTLVTVAGAINNGDIVTFYRTVPKDVLNQVYSDGAALSDDALNNNSKHLIMLSHEVMDGRFYFSGATYGWNMQGNRVYNIGAPTSSADAVTKGYVDALVVSAGSVPTPLPGDNAKALVANGSGGFSWSSTLGPMTLGTTTISSLTLTTDLSIAHGGTGSSTASGARTNLGLGTMATANAGAFPTVAPSSDGGTDLGTGSYNFGAVRTKSVDNSTGTLVLNGVTGSELWHNGAVKFSVGSVQLTAYDDIRPDTTNTYELGSNAQSWKTLYVQDIQSGSDALTLNGSGGVDIQKDGTTRIQVASTANIMGQTTRPLADNTIPIGTSGFRWTAVYAATGSINTSDEREKQDIAPISEAVFRACARIEWRQFRFKDAVLAKGENARIHIGAIAQQVVSAFAAEGLDAHDYGLICYDEWESNEEDGVPAGNRYGIRYEELLSLQVAYLHWVTATMQGG